MTAEMQESQPWAASSSGALRATNTPARTQQQQQEQQQLSPNRGMQPAGLTRPPPVGAPTTTHVCIIHQPYLGGVNQPAAAATRYLQKVELMSTQLSHTPPHVTGRTKRMNEREDGRMMLDI